ncbi:hypothetical protein QBC43DRAFT_309023 [Cladorrhinum sp. PSN259]|nr:hypothetical protein QBC43DRAFT_309023 [Cladorrhinum sp. PSN259]
MSPATDSNNNPTSPPSSSDFSSNAQNGNTSPSASTSSVGDHLAQALKDLARGEQTATALEANLTSLESKLDELLASFGILPEDGDEEHEADQKKTAVDGKDINAPKKEDS